MLNVLDRAYSVSRCSRPVNVTNGAQVLRTAQLLQTGTALAIPVIRHRPALHVRPEDDGVCSVKTLKGLLLVPGSLRPKSPLQGHSCRVAVQQADLHRHNSKESLLSSGTNTLQGALQQHTCRKHRQRLA